MPSDIRPLLKRYLKLSEQQQVAIEENDLRILNEYIREKELVINQMQVALKSERIRDSKSNIELMRQIAQFESANAKTLADAKNELGQQMQTSNQRKKVLNSYKNCL